METLTLKNIADGPVIVGGSYLWPGETRAVSAKLAHHLAAERPEALAILAQDGGVLLPADGQERTVLVDAVAELVDPDGAPVAVPEGDLAEALEHPAQVEVTDEESPGGEPADAGNPAPDGRAAAGRRARR